MRCSPFEVFDFLIPPDSKKVQVPVIGVVENMTDSVFDSRTGAAMVGFMILSSLLCSIVLCSALNSYS